MKTIITSTGETIDSGFDGRFGRAQWFCIYDDSSRNYEFIRNEFSIDVRGAGRNAAAWAAGLPAKRIISGDFGPGAKDILDRAGIQMIIIPDRDQSVGEVIGKLSG